MKIRNGFVSNSSSSSFVIIGFEVQPPKDLSDEGTDAFYDETIYIDSKNMYITGIKLTKSHDYGLEYAALNSKDIDKIRNNVAEAYDVDISEVKLYIGTRSC